MKSKYKFKAPIIATLFADSLDPDTIKYSLLIFCTSYAVNPVKIKTPSIDKANSIPGLLRNRFMMDAMINPNSPMIRNDPIPVKSFFVVYPYRLIAPNVADVTKNVLTMLVPVYTINIEDNDNPMMLAKIIR